MTNMTPKSRWLAAINLQPVDRLPFWPKLNAAYPKAQEPPFRDMTLDAIHDWIGSDKHTFLRSCVREQRTCTDVDSINQDGSMSTTIYRTPRGECRFIKTFDDASSSWHPTKFPVETRADIRIMTDVFNDVTVELDQDALNAARTLSETVGQDALTGNSIGESPLMYWVEWLAGVENAHFLLLDYPDEVEELFAAMHTVLLKKTELFCEYSPADVLYLIENTSTTLISPDQYRRYCVPHINEYAALTQGAGRSLVLHMCGYLLALLPDLARIPVQAFEAFTSPTLGNTSLLDGRSICTDKCLVGGTNAMLWTRSSEEIIAKIEKDLNALPHHRGIVVTSAGVMPPLCRPETIRDVCRWVKEYSPVQ